jgi:ketosteroid isomerase-like protein
MSEENVETIRRTYEAFSRGEFDTARRLAHPDIVLVPPGGQSPLRGAAVRAWMEPDAIAEQRSEPRELRVNGNRVLVRQHTWSRGAGSGIEVEADFWAVWTFDGDGLVTRIEVFLTDQETEAREAAGLSE